MATELNVGGYTATKIIDGQRVRMDVGNARLRTIGKLDLVVTGDGSKTMFEFIKEAANTMATTQAPAEPTPEWEELLKIPKNGTEIVISFGTRAEIHEPA